MGKVISRLNNDFLSLVLYDDAQSIYERARSKQFSFKSVGIQAQGRTTIRKINDLNTRQQLHTASLVAADLLTAEDKDDDGVSSSSSDDDDGGGGGAGGGRGWRRS